MPSTNSFVILLTAILLYEHLKQTSYAYKLYNPSEVPTQSQLAMGGLTVKPLYFVNVGQLPLMTPTSSEIIRNAVWTADFQACEKIYGHFTGRQALL